MLVFGSLMVMGNSLFGFSLVTSVKADVTWEQLNETVDLLKGYLTDYIDSKFDSYINQSMSDFDYIKNRLNETGYNITLDVNETDIVSRIADIQEMIGYEGDASIYEDLEAILTGLVDKNGDYILRDSAGNSILKYIFINQQNLSENQLMIVKKINDENNYTRGYMDDVGDDVVGDVGKKLNGVGGDGILAWIAAAGGLCSVWLVLWFFYLKPRLKRKYDMEEENINAGNTSNSNPESSGGTPFSNVRRSNPFSLRTGPSPSEPPPGCFKDGVSYDASEPACGGCIYRPLCSEAKIQQEAKDEHERLEAAERNKNMNVGPSIQISTGVTNGGVAQPLDINNW